MSRQDLRTIQSKVFNRIRTGSVENIDFLTDDNQKCSAADRLAIYQEGYRIRLREALEDDFPASLALWPEDVFEDFFETFVNETGSSTFTLNLIGKFWVEFIEHVLSEKSKVSPTLAKTLIELSKFEWSLSEVYFKNCNPFTELPLLTLDEESKLTARLTPAIQLFQSTHPVHEIYLNKKNYDPTSSYIIIWSPLPPKDFNTLTDFSEITGFDEHADIGSVKFAELTENEYLVWQSLLSTHNLSETQSWMTKLSWDETKQAELIQTIFEFGTERNILVPLGLKL